MRTRWDNYDNPMWACPDCGQFKVADRATVLAFRDAHKCPDDYLRAVGKLT